MSEIEAQGIVKCVFVWHSHTDACPKCRNVNGHEWVEQSIFQNTLWDMWWGDLWDLNQDHTLAHPNCRCQLEVRIEIDQKAIQEIINVRQLMEALPHGI